MGRHMAWDSAEATLTGKIEDAAQRHQQAEKLGFAVCPTLVPQP